MVRESGVGTHHLALRSAIRLLSIELLSQAAENLCNARRLHLCQKDVFTRVKKNLFSASIGSGGVGFPIMHV